MPTVNNKTTPMRAFTLIELVLVVALIGIVSMLVLSNPPKLKSGTSLDICKLREKLYPNGVFYLFDDGTSLMKKPDENTTCLNININFPKIYIYENGQFKEKEYDEYNNKKVVFEYRVQNGVGESFILSANGAYYVFKPFYIKKVDDFDKAREMFLNIWYFPHEGEIY